MSSIQIPRSQTGLVPATHRIEKDRLTSSKQWSPLPPRPPPEMFPYRGDYVKRERQKKFNTREEKSDRKKRNSSKCLDKTKQKKFLEKGKKLEWDTYQIGRNSHRCSKKEKGEKTKSKADSISFIRKSADWREQMNALQRKLDSEIALEFELDHALEEQEDDDSKSHSPLKPSVGSNFLKELGYVKESILNLLDYEKTDPTGEVQKCIQDPDKSQKAIESDPLQSPKSDTSDFSISDLTDNFNACINKSSSQPIPEASPEKSIWSCLETEQRIRIQASASEMCNAAMDFDSLESDLEYTCQLTPEKDRCQLSNNNKLDHHNSSQKSLLELNPEEDNIFYKASQHQSAEHIANDRSRKSMSVCPQEDKKVHSSQMTQGEEEKENIIPGSNCAASFHFSDKGTNDSDDKEAISCVSDVVSKIANELLAPLRPSTLQRLEYKRGNSRDVDSNRSFISDGQNSNHSRSIHSSTEAHIFQSLENSQNCNKENFKSCSSKPPSPRDSTQQIVGEEPDHPYYILPLSEDLRKGLSNDSSEETSQYCNKETSSIHSSEPSSPRNANYQIIAAKPVHPYYNLPLDKYTRHGLVKGKVTHCTSQQCYSSCSSISSLSFGLEKQVTTQSFSEK